MTRDGSIDPVNVVGIEYIDNGKSLRFELIETVPPYKTFYVVFRNTLTVNIGRMMDDEFPFIVVDFRWREIPDNKKAQVLARYEYPFFDESGKTISPKTQLVLTRIEGDITGNVISEHVVVCDDVDRGGEKGTQL